MKVTKQQIVDGICKFAENEVMPYIDVKIVKQILGAGIIALKMEPAIINKAMNNSLISAALKEEEGLYDLDFAEQIICETIKLYGPLEFVPPIPKFLLGGNENKTLKFSENDVKNLKSTIEKG